MNKFRKFVFVIAVVAAVTSPIAFAQVSYLVNGSTYTQNFDTLLAAGTGNPWVNNTTLPGWFLFHQPASAPVAITSYDAATGSVGTGTYYSFGAAASIDRSLGSVASGGAYWGSPAGGAVAGWSAVAFTNNTGSALSNFTVGFAGEQWRNGGNTTAQTLVMEYGFGATFAAVTTWTAPGSTFDFTSPVTGATAAAVDGNVAGRVNGLGGTVAASWGSGTTLWIRWVENNDAGNDHGLGIDDLTFSAVPEPSTWVAGALAVAILGWSQRRRIEHLVRRAAA